MQQPIQVTFRDIDPSQPIAAYVNKKAEKLDTFFDRIMGCRVAIEAPHRHHHQGKRYRVRIDLTVPGGELVVGRDPGDDSTHQDLYAAVDDAFDDAQRVLQDYARRKSDTRPPSVVRRRGRVKKLFTYEGYGFVETPEGEEIYFHKNAVQNGGFERMKIGSKVRFVEAPRESEEPPHASLVALKH